MNNEYFVLRHGRSLANEKNLICSHLENGIKDEYGLSSLGMEQAREAGRALKDDASLAGRKVVFLHSPFSRTTQTAKLAAEASGFADVEVVVEADLRERNFGDYELRTDESYREQWARDAESSASQPPGGGESIEDVAVRMFNIIQEAEVRYEGRVIILVSHGDPCQIIQAWVGGVDLKQHRAQFAMETGELRRLKFEV